MTTTSAAYGSMGLLSALVRAAPACLELPSSCRRRLLPVLPCNAQRVAWSYLEGHFGADHRRAKAPRWSPPHLVCARWLSGRSS